MFGTDPERPAPVRARWIAPLLAISSLCGLPSDTPADTPDELDGLVAWYRGETLGRRHADGGRITRWSDASGAGNDLELVEGGRPALLRAAGPNGKPVVDLERDSSFLVKHPFDLNDHTLFLVWRTKYPEQALLRSDVDRDQGVLLYGDHSLHRLWRGGAASTATAYNESAKLEDAYRIVTLARDDGVLRSWIDGEDDSSWSRERRPLRVGGMFHVELSQFAARDARGSFVAEILIYDRFLQEAERAKIHGHLSERYGIPVSVAPELALADRIERLVEVKDVNAAWLLPAPSSSLNARTGHRLVWKERKRVDSAFSHEDEENPTRIHCHEDGTRVRVHVALTVKAADPGTSLRVIVLKNGVDYHSEDAIAETLAVSEAVPVELEATLPLNRGDYIEILTFAHGAEGKIELMPGGAGVLVDAR